MSALTDRLHFLERLVRSLPEVVYWKDTEGRYQGCNENMVKIAGYNSIEEIIGKTDHEMAWRVIADKLMQNDKKVVTTGQEFVFQEIVSKDVNGQYRIMHSSKTPLRDEHGKIIGVLGVSTDVSAFDISDHLNAIKQDVLGNKILLIEDNELIQKVHSFQLKALGYDVIDIAADVDIGLQKTLMKKYDLIYLGINLTDRRDLAFMEQLRNNKQSPNQNAVVIAWSAFADLALEKECLAMGVNRVLFKPLSVNEMKSLILELQPNKSSESLVVDWTLWRKRCGNHEDLVQQAWDITMRMLPDFKAQSSAALQAKDYGKLDEVVHKCYGGLKYCGLPILEAATLALEQAVRGKRYNELDELHKKFIHEIDVALELKYNPQ